MDKIRYHAPIDKSLSIDQNMLIDINCIDQSIEIDTRNFFPNLSIFIDFIDFLPILSIDEKLLILV